MSKLRFRKLEEGLYEKDLIEVIHRKDGLFGYVRWDTTWKCYFWDSEKCRIRKDELDQISQKLKELNGK